MKDMLKNNFLKSISIALIAVSAVQFVFAFIYFNTDLPDALYDLFLQNIADKTEDMRLIAQRFSMAIGYLLMVQSLAYLFMGIAGVRQRRLSIAINLSTLVLGSSLLIYMFMQTPDLIKILFEQYYLGANAAKTMFLDVVRWLTTIQFVPTVCLWLVIPYLASATQLCKNRAKIEHATFHGGC